MVAPQRRYGASVSPRPVAPRVEREKAARRRAGGPAARQKAASRRRRFAVVVVIPVLLMLGSVYLHTVSAVLTDKAAYLDERLAEVRAKGERLDVRVAELSGAGRIRPLAIDKLGMKDPRGARLKVYDLVREDGARNGGEKEGGK